MPYSIRRFFRRPAFLVSVIATVAAVLDCFYWYRDSAPHIGGLAQLSLIGALLGCYSVWGVWALGKPRPLIRFPTDSIGIIIDGRSYPKFSAARMAIPRIAATTPLAGLIEIQVAEAGIDWPEDAKKRRTITDGLRKDFNAHALLRFGARGARRSREFIVLSGPALPISPIPRLLCAELYEWIVDEELFTFAVAWSLYRKRFFKETIDLLKSANKPYQEFLTGCAHLRDDRPLAAEVAFTKVLVAWDRRVYPDLWGRVQHNLGVAKLLAGDLESGLATLNAALEVRTRNDYPVGWAYTVNNVAMGRARQGQLDEARDLLSSAIPVLMDDDRHFEAEQLQDNLAWVNSLQSQSQPSLTAEVEEARRQIGALIGMPHGPFVRPGLRIAHRLVQATTVSGDFYGIVPRRDGTVGIYLVDVEGHGLAASGTAVAIERILSRPGLDWGQGEPRAQLEAADVLIEDELSHNEIVVSMNFTEIDPYGKRIRLANAGMPFPLLFRYGQSQPEVLQAAGIYVGAGYRRTQTRPDRAEALLHDGDVLLIFRDGIPEALNSRGRLFGQNGIISAVARSGLDSPEAIVDEILRAVNEYSGKERPDDDQAILAVQVGTPPTLTQKAGLATLTEMPSDQGIVFEIFNADDTGATVTGTLKDRLLQFVSVSGTGDDLGLRIWNASWEAIQNAMKHGSSRADVIRFEAKPVPSGIEVVVSQPRRWLDWDVELGSRRPTHELGEDGGVGTLIMLRLADSVFVTDHGRRIHLLFNSETPVAAGASGS